MNKLHIQNGFEYKHTKSCFSGVWHYTWYFKPLEAPIFLTYTCTDKPKTLKADLTSFLSNPVKAKKKYYSDLESQNNVEQAKEILAIAKSRYEKVNSPDFDLKGNNPNSESNARKNAQSSLDSAISSLERATRYKSILDACV